MLTLEGIKLKTPNTPKTRKLTIHSLLQLTKTNIHPCRLVKQKTAIHYQNSNKNKPTTKHNPKHKQQSENTKTNTLTQNKKQHKTQKTSS
jgi:hypothetical protein